MLIDNVSRGTLVKRIYFSLIVSRETIKSTKIKSIVIQRVLIG